MGTFLRMIIDQVLKRFKVPYLELLSSHSAKERVDIVERFNSDESIRVLILTTAVGGLGLTLTGADTVIFAEHDWIKCNLESYEGLASHRPCSSYWADPPGLRLQTNYAGHSGGKNYEPVTFQGEFGSVPRSVQRCIN